MNDICNRHHQQTQDISVGITVTGDFVTVVLRDNCLDFDYQTVSPDPMHLEHHIGIRMMLGMAKKIKHVNLYGTNCLTIVI